MSSPQFTRQSARPLTLAAYVAFASRLRRAADHIERQARDPPTPTSRRGLTRAVHALTYAVRHFRRRHDRLLLDHERLEQHEADQKGDPR